MRFSVPVFLTSFTLAAAMVAQRQAAGDVTCQNGTPNSIVTADIQGLIDDLNTGNQIGTVPNPIDLRSLFTLNAVHSVTFTRGTVAVEVDNGQPFFSTHVSYQQLAAALSTLKGQCCGDFPNCIGGNTGVHGDTGLVVAVSMRPNGS